MTTHVFIVDETTLKYHLEYMFAGTGAENKAVDFNNCRTTKLYAGRKYQGENNLVGMMADGCRIRKDDLIIFYLRAVNKKHDGMFFGIFQAVDDGIFLDNNDGKQFLEKELKKQLTFRLKIKPYEVYANGVTEWTALDEIKSICSPYQMLWSLIYRKLKGHRGNTMITLYEANRLIRLIRTENNNKQLSITKGEGLSFDDKCTCIITTNDNAYYTGREEVINILPRLIEKNSKNEKYEAHLQMFITQNVGRGTNKSLDKALGINGKKLEWIGNEVSCGVGMQRIDVMISVDESKTKKILMPIELKVEAAYDDNTKQLNRYLDWIEQYYIPNSTESIIQPVLICKGGSLLSTSLKQNFNDFNKRKGILPLKYIEYSITAGNIAFNQVSY